MTVYLSFLLGLAEDSVLETDLFDDLYTLEQQLTLVKVGQPQCRVLVIKGNIHTVYSYIDRSTHLKYKNRHIFKSDIGI